MAENSNEDLVVTSDEASAKNKNLEKIADILIETAKMHATPNLFKTSEEWEESGVLLLKRKLLGFFGYNKTLSADSIVLTLQLNNFVNSQDQGIELLKLLEKKWVLHYEGKRLYFNRITSLGSNDYFRISTEGFLF